jgi:SAM-dependent methyltransferase
MTSDTGSQLRALYTAEGGVTQIFSSKVTDYAASRPDYPSVLFEALTQECQLTEGSSIADVGAGTGLLTRGLLAQGYSVIAVEPNDGMRAAADQALAGNANYRSVQGTAESLPLPDASMDLITAAQAFHWFDIGSARREFLRVLCPRGQVALVWNDRVLEDPLHRALDDVFAEFGGAKRGALLSHENRDSVPAFFRSPTREFRWPHAHRLDGNGLLRLVLSRSYMPQANTPAGTEVAMRVHAIYQQHSSPQGVDVHYRTVAIMGRPS